MSKEQLENLIEKQYQEELIEIENLLKTKLNKEKKAILKRRIRIEVELWYS